MIRLRIYSAARPPRIFAPSFGFAAAGNAETDVNAIDAASTVAISYLVMSFPFDMCRRVFAGSDETDLGAKGGAKQ